MRAIVSLILCVVVSSQGFYLPGVAQNEYIKHAPVELKVIKIDSVKTLLPYRYYELPFCEPEGGVKDMIDNLGEILVGDRIENSPYYIDALVNVPCKKLCAKSYTKKQMEQFRQFIADDYKAHWMVDNLPAAFNKHMMLVDKKGHETPLYSEGFPLGKLERAGFPKGKEPSKADYDKADVVLHNHVTLRLSYNADNDQDAANGPVRIVQFEVIPKSVKYGDRDIKGGDGIPKGCGDKSLPQLVIKGDGKATDERVLFTYSVEWIRSDVKWSTRWDIFLQEEGDDQIHWFSIINSLMIVLFLTGIVAVIMLKTVSADFRKYRELETQEEAQEETGWKLVHGDVFRPPGHEMLLSVFVGNGVQVLTMTAITLLVALLGFLSPANRGSLLTSIAVLYALMGTQAGYVSARLYKLMKGVQWKRNTVQTALLVPGICLSIFFVLNIVLGFEDSSAAVGFLRLFTIAFLWIGVSVPLVFAGAYWGYRKDAIELPCKVNQIPRQVPPQVWYQGPFVSVLMGGVLPFGAIFIELFFILSSLWLHQFYYLFPFLFLVFLILIVTCAEITIVMTYFQLIAEDYRWWWRSFLTSGCSALYMFVYSIVYFATRLSITRPVSIVLYFGYTTIFASLFFVMTGTVGFLSCYWFVSKIYSVIKSD